MKSTKYFVALLMIGLTANTFSQVIRKDYREFTTTERQAFLTAFNTLWQQNIPNTVELYRIVHSNLFDSIHDSGDDAQNPFLPWHREFLRQFELYLKNVDLDVTIPYWNWIEDQSTSAAIWGSSWLGPYDDFSFYYFDIIHRVPGPDPLPTQAELTVALNETDFPSFTSRLEETPLHDRVHCWISDAMCSIANAPAEPAFSFSHAFLDKIWQDWVNSNYSVMQTWVNSTGWTNPMP